MGYLIDTDESVDIEKPKDENFIGQKIDEDFLKRLAARHAPEEPPPQEDESWLWPLLYGAGRYARGVAKGTASSIPGQVGDIASMFATSAAPPTHQLEEMFGWQNATGAEKAGMRAGHIAGPLLTAAATGGVSLLSQIPRLFAQAGIGGAAGSAAEALGAGPIVQALAELLGGFGAGKFTKAAPVTSKVANVEKELQHLEQMGVSPESRTILKHAGEKNYRPAKGAAKSAEAQQAVERASHELTEAATNIQKKAIPGYEKGRKFMESNKDRVFRELQKGADAVEIVNPDRLVRTLDHLIYQAQKVPAASAERNTFIETLKKFRESAAKGMNLNGDPLTAGDLLNFYRENNSSYGRWANSFIKQGAMRDLQKSLIKTTAEQGTNGKLIAESWTNSNKFYQKYKKTVEALDKLEGLVHEGQIDFKGLSRKLKNPDDRHLLTEVLGQESVHDLGRLAKQSENLGALKQAMQSAELRGLLEKGSLTGIAGAIFSTLTNATGPWTIAAATVPFGLIKGEQALQKKILTDPRYQNMAANFLESATKGAAKQATTWAAKIEEALRSDIKKEAPEETQQASLQKKRFRIDAD